MAVIRVNKTKDYTVMSNTHLKDKNLSLKAKGLLSIMLSLPDSWTYSIDGLVAICKESEKAVKSTLDELKKNKYLEITKERNDKGRFSYIYNIYEKPGYHFPPVDEPGVENAGQLNTNNKNTKNKEKVNKKKNANFEQREYTEEDLQKLYNNI